MHERTGRIAARAVLGVALAFAGLVVQGAPAGAQAAVRAEAVAGPCGSVLDWATTLNRALQPGDDGYYNRMTAPVSGCGYAATQRAGHDSPTEKYWCTNLVIDAYNLAGIPGLTTAPGPGVTASWLPPPGHQQVITMAEWWMTAPGYTYVNLRSGDRRATIQQVRPGFAIFYESVFGQENGNEHVALVSSISVDAQGTGQLTTIDSNAEAKQFTYRVVHGTVQNPPYPVIGFGGR
jgi:hypothetical protein